MNRVKCDECLQQIHGKPLKCFVTGKIFHYKCMQCLACKTPLKGYVKSCRNSSITNFFHEPCFNCSTCKGKINPRLSQVVNENIFCSECVPCLICRKKEGGEKLRLHVSSKKCIFVHGLCVRCLKCGIADSKVDIDEEGKVFHPKCSAKKCALCLQTLGATYVKYHGLYIHDSCREKMQAFVSPCGQELFLERLWQPSWNRLNHYMFFPEVRQTIEMLFLFRKRKTIFSLLPKDLVFYLASWIATPNGWNTIDGRSIYDICTSNRCATMLHCSCCESIIPAFSTPLSCSSQKCVKYKYACPACNDKISYDEDDEISCTPYRCIRETCSLCDGGIICNEEDDRPLCRKDNCYTFVNRCDSCQNLIRHEMVDPLVECTIYRCLQEKCSCCGLDLEPFPDFSNDMCRPEVCVFREKEKTNLTLFLNRELKIDEKIAALPHHHLYRHYYFAFSNLLLSKDSKDINVSIFAALERWKYLYKV